MEKKIDYHYYILGRVLFELAAQGLKRVDFDSSSAFEIMDYRHGDEEDVLQDFCDVLHFMINEKIISARSIQEFDGGYAFNGVQLTSKGLQLVNEKAGLSEIRGSIVENATATQSNNQSAPYAKWGEFIGGLLGSFTNSIGGN
jgi:hypothetical protein